MSPLDPHNGRFLCRPCPVPSSSAARADFPTTSRWVVKPTSRLPDEIIGSGSPWTKKMRLNEGGRPAYDFLRGLSSALAKLSVLCLYIIRLLWKRRRSHPWIQQSSICSQLYTWISLSLWGAASSSLSTMFLVLVYKFVLSATWISPTNE